MNPKHKKVKCTHNYHRKNLKLMVEGWKLITRGMEKFDRAMLNEVLSIRRKDKKGRS